MKTYFVTELIYSYQQHAIILMSMLLIQVNGTYMILKICMDRVNIF